MTKLYTKILNKLVTTIHELELETDCPIQKAETIIKLIIENLSDLKVYILENGFKDTDEEIQFFKNQKPTIVSKLIYYNAVYKIETKKPYGEKKTKKIQSKTASERRKDPEQRIEQAQKIL